MVASVQTTTTSEFGDGEIDPLAGYGHACLWRWERSIHDGRLHGYWTLSFNNRTEELWAIGAEVCWMGFLDLHSLSISLSALSVSPNPDMFFRL